MAKNWSAAEAARVVFLGEDKAAIQDIGKRFPLFATAAARGVEGMLEIIGALNPERITVRTIESKLKEDVGEYDEEEAEVEEKPKTKAKPATKTPAKGKKKPEPEEEDEDEDEEEEETPKKSSKGKSAPAKGKGKKKPEPEEEEDEDDEDDDGLEEMSLTELKKEAKKRKVDIKGLKSADDIIEAIRDAEGEEDDEDEDEDDWDI